MSNLRLPRKHLPGLRIFLELPDDVFEKLIAELRASPWTVNTEASLAASIEKIESLSADDRSKLSAALMSLCLGHAGSSLSVADFIEDVVTALEETPGALTSERSQATIKPRLLTLLSIEPLAISAKALSLYAEQATIFSKARIVTDVRPVFADSVKDAPPGAIIIHTMNLHYYGGAEHKEFFVTMDTDDLQDLINILKRAQEKAAGIETTVKKAGLSLIGKKPQKGD